MERFITNIFNNEDHWNQDPVEFKQLAAQCKEIVEDPAAANSQLKDLVHKLLSVLQTSTLIKKSLEFNRRLKKSKDGDSYALVGLASKLRKLDAAIVKFHTTYRREMLEYVEFFESGENCDGGLALARLSELFDEVANTSRTLTRDFDALAAEMDVKFPSKEETVDVKCTLWTIKDMARRLQEGSGDNDFAALFGVVRSVSAVLRRNNFELLPEDYEQRVAIIRKVDRFQKKFPGRSYGGMKCELDLVAIRRRMKAMHEENEESLAALERECACLLELCDCLKNLDSSLRPPDAVNERNVTKLLNKLAEVYSSIDKQLDRVREDVDRVWNNFS